MLGVAKADAAPLSGRISILVGCSLGLTLSSACTGAGISFVWSEGEVHICYYFYDTVDVQLSQYC